ncbi:hypothetical protein ACOMHN_038372 [Nucella lapillus]
MATFTVEGETRKDEIKTFQTGHYISTNEAVWRIFSFDLHQRYPPVVNLSVHLENGQRVYYTEKTGHQRAQAPPETTLTAFFKLCQSDEFARTLLYPECQHTSGGSSQARSGSGTKGDRLWRGKRELRLVTRLDESTQYTQKTGSASTYDSFFTQSRGPLPLKISGLLQVWCVTLTKRHAV